MRIVESKMKSTISAIITVVILSLLCSCSTTPPEGTKFNLGSDDPYRQGQSLVEAIAHGANSAAYRLMEQGAPLNYQDKKDEWTPLIYAIYHHNWRMAKVIIRAGANVNLADNANRTALMWAALRNSGITAKLLVEYGADINAVDINGRTALQYAVIYTNYTLAAYLAEAGRRPPSQRMKKEQFDRFKAKLAREKAEKENLKLFGTTKKREVIAEVKKKDINKAVPEENGKQTPSGIPAKEIKKAIASQAAAKPSPSPVPAQKKKITVNELIQNLQKKENSNTQKPAADSSTAQDKKTNE
jgi:hypothetical protein